MNMCAIKVSAQITKAEIIATGLTCSMCSNAINKQFKTMPEVENVTTDLNSNTFTIYLKRGNKLTPKTLKDKVEKAGFFVGSLVLTMPFNNMKAADNVTYTTNDVSYIFVDTKTQILQGDVKVKVLDKGYITQKEYKKLETSYKKYPTYVLNTNNNFHLKTL